MNNKVFRLVHAYSPSDEEPLRVKLIGFFDSHDKAKAIREQLKLKPGFDLWPDGFEIKEFIIGQINMDDEYTLS